MTILSVLMLVAAAPHSTRAQSAVPMPYYDPAGRQPTHYAEYVQTQEQLPYRERVVSESPKAGAGCEVTYNKLVLVFINAYLYPEVQSDISTWLADVQTAGFSTKLIAVTGGTARNLRQSLIAHRDSGLVGSIMVGNLPIAWWEDSPNSGEDYPMDLFFTDLTGTWSDGNGNGIYDTHSNTGPGIWLGRIDASRLTYGNEAQIIHEYFQRNHVFRTNQMAIPHRGLVLSNVFYTSDHGMSSMLTSVTNYGCNSSTSGYFYKNQLLQGYEFVHLVSHSSPWVNSFFDPTTTYGTGSVFNFEIPFLGPHAVFYFLNACMCGRYSERDNLGNWYALCSPCGQIVLASTQTMYGDDDLSELYGALGADSTIGGAFLQWHRDNYDWMFAMCILGDPTLKVNRTQEPESPPKPPESHPGAITDWMTYPVDTTNFVSARPRLGCSQGRIRLLYDSGRIVRSDNFFSWFNGTNFTQPESVAWEDYYDLFPACCTDSSGRYWMAWQSFRDYDQNGTEHFQVFSTYYNGSTWSSVTRVGPLGGYHDLQPALAAAHGDTVWCAFQSWRNGQADIWVSSEVHGGSWSTPVRLTTDSLEQLYPCIAVDQAGHPWVFWMTQANGRWCIQGRENAGGWQPAFMLDTVGSNGPPRAAVDGSGSVWVIYSKVQGLQSDIYYACHSGSQWTAPTALTATSGDEELPDLTCGRDGSIWACWETDTSTNGPGAIYVAQYSDGWTTPVPITADNAHYTDPSIISDTNGDIWIAYASDRRGYWNIYAAVTSATGASENPTNHMPPAAPVAVSPNPFANQVTFTGRAGFAVEVYAANGRRVASLAAPKGLANWTPGKDARGVYLARIRPSADGPESVVKLVCTQ